MRRDGREWTLTESSFASACGASCFSTSATMESNSTGSRVNPGQPASARASESKRSTRSVMRTADDRQDSRAERYSSGERLRQRANSAWLRMTGEWRAQFVRRVGRESRLPFEGGFEPFERAIQGPGKPFEFHFDLRFIDPLGEILGRDPSGHRRHRFDRLEDPPRHEPAADHAYGHHDRPGHDQLPAQDGQFAMNPFDGPTDKND